MYPSLMGKTSPWDIYSNDDPESTVQEQAPVSPQLKAALSPPPGVMFGPSPRPSAPTGGPRAFWGSAPVPAAQTKGSGMSLTNNAQQTTKEEQNAKIARWANSQQMQDIAEGIRALPEVRDQAEGQAMNRALFRQELLHRPAPDLATPLANLADYVSTGQLGDRKPAENPKDVANRLREWAKQTQDDQRDLAKTTMEGVRNYKAGLDQNMLYTQLLNQQTNKAQDPNMAQRGLGLDAREELQNRQQAYSAHQATVNAIKKDPQLKAMLGSNFGIDSALNLVNKSRNLTPEIIQEFQVGLRNALQMTKGQTVGAERAATYMDWAGKHVDEFNQIINGEPADIAKNHPIVQHIKDMAAIEGANVHSKLMDRLDVASGGNSWVYSNPQFSRYADSLKGLLGAVQKQGVSQAAQPKKPGPDFNAILQQLMKEGH